MARSILVALALLAAAADAQVTTLSFYDCRESAEKVSLLLQGTPTLSACSLERPTPPRGTQPWTSATGPLLRRPCLVKPSEPPPL